MLTERSVAAQIFYRRSHGCTKSRRTLIESTANSGKVDRSWQNVPRMQKMLTEDPAEPWKFDGSWQNVLRAQGKLTKVYRRSCWCTENWCKFTEGLADARKDDRSWRKVVLTQRKFAECLRPHRNLTEGTAAIRKVHRRSRGCKESWHNVRSCVEVKKRSWP